jgi:hypothetical protein
MLYFLKTKILVFTTQIQLNTILLFIVYLIHYSLHMHIKIY